MPKINMSVHIERPIEEVFSAFTDVRTQPQWDPGLLEGRHEPDAPAQLGTKITEVRKFMGRVSENTSELVEFEANRKIKLTSFKILFPFILLSFYTKWIGPE